jgi:hypothetical protein
MSKTLSSVAYETVSYKIGGKKGDEDEKEIWNGMVLFLV